MTTMRVKTGAAVVRAPHRWLFALALGLLLALAACADDQDAAVDEPDGGNGDAEDVDEGNDDGDGDDAEAAAEDRLILGHPGHLRPIWSSTWLYITEEFGFYEEYDVSVGIRPLRSGGDVTQATHTGEIDGGLTASSPAIGAMAEGASIQAIAGMDQVDWILVTNNPDIESCEDVEGHESGAMAPGDSRFLILEQILENCGVDIADVETVDTTGDHVGPLVAGVLDTHVLHIDELAQVEYQTDEDWRILERMSEVTDEHYLPFVINDESLEQKEDAVVRMLAAQIDAVRFMHDPDNFDDIADFLHGVVEQDDRDLILATYEEYIDMNWWQLDEPGIDQGLIEATIQTQHDVGNIDETFDYDEYFTTEYWDRALEMVEEGG